MRISNWSSDVCSSDLTLVLLRWTAIVGQLLAILFVHFGLDFRLPLLPALGVVGVSALLNIVLFIVYPSAKRLTEAGATGYLAFDQIGRASGRERVCQYV